MFGVATLDGFGLGSRPALAAAGGLVAYLDYAAKGTLPFLRPPELACDDSSHLSVVLHALDWLRDHANAGRLVLLGDPGRNYFTAQGLEELARYEIPTSLQLENRGMRETVVWRVLPHP